MKLDRTPDNYLKQMIKVTLDELKIPKTAHEAFNATMDYPMKEDLLRILDTYVRPGQVCSFPGEAEVKVLVDVLKKYDPDYYESVRSKSCLKKMSLIFISSTSHTIAK